MISIFDEIDTKVNNCTQFWHSLDEYALEDIKENKIFEGVLRLLSANKLGKERLFVLTKTSIYSFNKRNDRIPQLMSKINWKLVEAFIEHNLEEERYGFKIFQNTISQDFFVKSSEDLDIWINHLSSISIMTDLEDDYSFIKQIGKGSFADVYLAQDLDNDDKYAIKRISKNKSQMNAIGSKGMINEIEIMRKLKHPYILTLHKIYETEHHINLILDYVEGGELFQRIMQNGKILESYAAKFCANLLDALEYLHSQNIMHRDLKPENILMVSKFNDYEFKISDFGLAVQTQEKQELRCGSPGYVAPEILRKEPYGKEIDLFSTGILMYVILSGRAPFPGKDTKEILYRNKECRIYFQDKYWNEISQKAIDMVQRLTDPNPEFRISINDAKEHPWISFLTKKTHRKIYIPKQLEESKDKIVSPRSGNASMIKISYRAHNEKRGEHGFATERVGKDKHSWVGVLLKKHHKIVTPTHRAKIMASGDE
ncbi:unnamed protein product [Blepharisma stoltei]|uniref:Protein kinase domain-containing protein n=1 Tax=Blepharisma stoltei TaxID=1481888 RepID=A0AAU9JTB0_9CILI|nr:unnamed protein product [Blepharisma stoltei]